MEIMNIFKGKNGYISREIMNIYNRKERYIYLKENDEYI